MIKNGIFLLSILVLASCAEPVGKPVKSYVDIKGFFESEVSRLAVKNTLVDKTVKRNEVSETRQGSPVEWKNELVLFIESDINKPAWHGSYKITKDSSGISYTALDADLRTRSIRIQKGANERLQHISIQNVTRNYLYQSSEELNYYPDSVYTINKTQSVLLLGRNKYTIIGRFK
jgi:hypothetical protein